VDAAPLSKVMRRVPAIVPRRAQSVVLILVRSNAEPAAEPADRAREEARMRPSLRLACQRMSFGSQWTRSTARRLIGLARRSDVLDRAHSTAAEGRSRDRSHPPRAARQ
jgi:hypothetical protein